MYCCILNQPEFNNHCSSLTLLLYPTHTTVICTKYNFYSFRTQVICTVTCLIGGHWELNASSCALPGSKFLIQSDIFIVPSGVTSVRALLVGGGMGNDGGTAGSGGYVQCGTFNISSGSAITLSVGSGSAGSSIVGNSGGTSSFGSYIQAAGAAFPGIKCDGYDGGTGSGARATSLVYSYFVYDSLILVNIINLYSTRVMVLITVFILPSFKGKA